MALNARQGALRGLLEQAQPTTTHQGTPHHAANATTDHTTDQNSPRTSVSKSAANLCNISATSSLIRIEADIACICDAFAKERFFVIRQPQGQCKISNAVQKRKPTQRSLNHLREDLTACREKGILVADGVEMDLACKIFQKITREKGGCA